MKKNNKGFTLIELLVVVAIIGILAAVGTLAYTGYTKSARKSATASNHANVVKYVASEMAKCVVEDTAFKPAGGTAWDCTNKSKTDATGTAASAVNALADFKNPYSTSNAAVTHTPTTTNNDSDVGYTRVIQGTGKVTVSTCFATSCGTSSNVTSNEITIE